MTTLELSALGQPAAWWGRLPDVHSRCVQRFFVNYRLPLDRARAILPPQLEPLPVAGVAVASACILQIDRVVPTIALPLGHASRNCAHRIAVVHRATGQQGVYVHSRNSGSRLVAWLTELGFPGRHRLVDMAIDRAGPGWDIRMDLGRPLLHVRARPGATGSTLFPATAGFTDFIAGGVRSWAPSILPGRLVVVDLLKETTGSFTPLAVEIAEDEMLADWLGAPAGPALDSAFRTVGGHYTWRYIGIE